jgi:hypothetical protein
LNFKIRFNVPVLDIKSQCIPEVVVARRGQLGFWEVGGGVGQLGEGVQTGQFTSNLRGRRTIPVTSGGSQVSVRGRKGELARGTRGNAPCIYVNVMCVPE